MVIRQAIRHALQAGRSFSTSTPRCAVYKCYIGREPVPYPPTVSFAQTPEALSVKGPLGTTSVPLKPYMDIVLNQDNTLAVSVQDPSVKDQRAMWGTTRTHIHNAVIGMTEGFSTPLYLVGVGYRVALEADPKGKTEGVSGQRLNMKLGFSHPVYVPIPEHIKAEALSPTKIMLSCTDKQLLGLFAAKVRAHRPPEPYKGKGIIVGDERVRIKKISKK
ncbi:ribosomal protein L6 [Daedalea quercina L-15889]|uniref:Ribosomal protein L6 n=1 Tax=Daedalea quercina L-15889 TaxID=1314783 RepID=A0A165TQZ3_9APHY|nr:ribosomal protein L6 [Daedalea quercina L-15889]